MWLLFKRKGLLPSGLCIAYVIFCVIHCLCIAYVRFGHVMFLRCVNRTTGPPFPSGPAIHRAPSLRMSRSPGPSDMPLQVAPVEEDSCESMTPWPSWKLVLFFAKSGWGILWIVATARRTLNEDSVPFPSSQRLSPALDVAWALPRTGALPLAWPLPLQHHLVLQLQKLAWRQRPPEILNRISLVFFSATKLTWNRWAQGLHLNLVSELRLHHDQSTSPHPETRVCSKKASFRKEGAKKLATGMLESFRCNWSV